MDKDGFIIYKSIYKPISKLSNEQLGRLFRAVLQQQNDETPELAPDIEMAFDFINTQIKIETQKYEERCRRNKENIKKRWEREKAQKKDDTNVYDRIRQEKSNTKGRGKEEDEEKDEVIVSNDTGLKPPKGGKEEEEEEDVRKRKNDAESFCKRAVALWNKGVEEFGSTMKPINRPTEVQRKQLTRLYERFGWRTYAQGIETALKDPYLNARTSRSDRPAKFSWITKEQNFEKILAGDI